MSKNQRGECRFKFEVTGYMKKASHKDKTEFYESQIKLALKNANIQPTTMIVIFKK